MDEQQIKLTVSRNLKTAMYERGVNSVAHLSRITGITEQTIRNLVTAKQQTQYFFMLRLCEALRITPDWLFGYTKTPPNWRDGTFKILTEYTEKLSPYKRGGCIKCQYHGTEKCKFCLDDLEVNKK